jgi:hypothetical protein
MDGKYKQQPTRQGGLIARFGKKEQKGEFFDGVQDEVWRPYGRRK